MRFILVLVFFAVGGLVRVSAQEQREDIVLTGGCALRFMEHGKGAVSHDVYWFNFVDASTIWLKQIKEQHPGDIVTWLIYRPSYARRSEEMGVDLLAQLQQRANTLGVYVGEILISPKILSRTLMARKYYAVHARCQALGVNWR